MKTMHYRIKLISNRSISETACGLKFDLETEAEDKTSTWIEYEVNPDSSYYVLCEECRDLRPVCLLNINPGEY